MLKPAYLLSQRMFSI